MIKQLLNSVIAKYRDLSLFRSSIIDLLPTDKSRYFAQPRPIIVNYCSHGEIVSLIPLLVQIVILGSLSKDDGNGNDNATKQSV